MKINNLKNKEIITIDCPVCGKTSEVNRVRVIKIDERFMELHDGVGKIYQCLRPECMAYLKKVNDEFEPIDEYKIIERQKKITDLLLAEAEVARARLVPAVVEAEVIKAEIGRALSPLLFHLTADRPPVHRAYSVAEILEACGMIGFNPLEVNSRRIGFVLNWLKEHKD